MENTFKHMNIAKFNKRSSLDFLAMYVGPFASNADLFILSSKCC